jgi:hypothetical protein
LPAVDKYKPEYYRLDTLSCSRDVSASILRDEIQIRKIKEGGIANNSVILQERCRGRLQDFTDFWDTWCSKDKPVPVIIRHGLHMDFVS